MTLPQIIALLKFEIISQYSNFKGFTPDFRRATENPELVSERGRRYYRFPGLEKVRSLTGARRPFRLRSEHQTRQLIRFSTELFRFQSLRLPHGFRLCASCFRY